MMDREYIIAAACVVRNGELLPPSVKNRNLAIGMTHTAILEYGEKTGRKIYRREDTKGFLTSQLRFVNRWEAMKIAKSAGQIVTGQYALFSDDFDLKSYYRRYQDDFPQMARLLREFEID